MNVMQLFSLKDKVAIVTGGGRGIGQFMARGLAEAGANVVVSSRKIDKLEAECENLKSLGVKAKAVKCDIEKEDDIHNLVKQTMDEFGRIDILINNAGVTWGTPSLKFPLDKWDKIFNVNVRGLWILSQEVANIMKAQGGGNIINITSIMGLRGAPDIAQPAIAYNASKGAIITLTKDMAIKWAPFKIRVNSIAPGFFDTDMMAHIHKPEFKAMKNMLLAQIPLVRVATEDDIKGLVVMLVSEAGNYITGAIIPVDGGYLAK